MRIAPATPEQAQAILEVRREVRADTYANEQLDITASYLLELNAIDQTKIEAEAARISSPQRQYWVAMSSDEELVGYIKMSTHPHQSLDFLHVRKPHQEQGLGRRLLAKGLGWVSINEPVYVEVTEYNEMATNWYRRLGWQPTGKTLDSIPLPSPHTGFVKEYEMVLQPHLIGDTLARVTSIDRPVSAEKSG